jgi:uncharacterized protein DUF4242
MVYVVERYLPGLSRSDLLHGLSRLERAQELQGEAAEVRYLDSTVVLEDEACFCRFAGPTEAAVAEANRRAGLPFDRIVSAVTVQPERSTTMNVSTTIPATVHIRRGRLFGLIGLVAVLAAAITWAFVTFVANTGDDSVRASSGTPTSYELAVGHANGLAALGQMQQVQDELPVSYANGLAALGRMQWVQDELSLGYANGLAAVGRMQRTLPASPAAHNMRKVTSIMQLTPAEVAAGALWGYALPRPKNGLTRESVLASLSPTSRRYVEAVTALTFEQLAAGAAGSP